jgi:nicotinamide riboside transporter PnuC
MSERIKLMAVEEHEGNQFIRVKSWPRCTPAGIVMTLFFAAMGAASAAAQAWVACGVLNAIALILMMRVMIECSSAMSTVTEVLDHKE